MKQENGLNRFLEAQNMRWETALSEIRNGKKQSHWMWYIFPQITGLGYSSISKYYAIRDISEAQDYLNHEILGKRLIEISNELLKLKGDSATAVFGSPDDMKLKSSMTLFSLVPDTDKVFQQVLDKYCNGEADIRTVQIVQQG